MSSQSGASNSFQIKSRPTASYMFRPSEKVKSPSENRIKKTVGSVPRTSSAASSSISSHRRQSTSTSGLKNVYNPRDDDDENEVFEEDGKNVTGNDVNSIHGSHGIGKATSTARSVPSASQVSVSAAYETKKIPIDDTMSLIIKFKNPPPGPQQQQAQSIDHESTPHSTQYETSSTASNVNVQRQLRQQQQQQQSNRSTSFVDDMSHGSSRKRRCRDDGTAEDVGLLDDMDEEFVVLDDEMEEEIVDIPVSQMFVRVRSIGGNKKSRSAIVGSTSGLSLDGDSKSGRKAGVSDVGMEVKLSKSGNYGKGKENRGSSRHDQFNNLQGQGQGLANKPRPNIINRRDNNDMNVVDPNDIYYPPSVNNTITRPRPIIKFEKGTQTHSIFPTTSSTNPNTNITTTIFTNNSNNNKTTVTTTNSSKPFPPLPLLDSKRNESYETLGLAEILDPLADRLYNTTSSMSHRNFSTSQLSVELCRGLVCICTSSKAFQECALPIRLDMLLRELILDFKKFQFICMKVLGYDAGMVVEYCKSDVEALGEVEWKRKVGKTRRVYWNLFGVDPVESEFDEGGWCWELEVGEGDGKGSVGVVKDDGCSNNESVNNYVDFGEIDFDFDEEMEIVLARGKAVPKEREEVEERRGNGTKNDDDLEFQISVVTSFNSSTSSSMNLLVSGFDRVDDVKRIVQVRVDDPTDRVFMVGGRQIVDGNVRLGECGVSRGTKVYVFVSRRLRVVGVNKTGSMFVASGGGEGGASKDDGTGDSGKFS
ncbi:hypothetical protein HDU76_001532 [Blyttiomyces sp. JEL0837]|nr:hypothetical protein HDU76_001532 [Blyttiomyces sp. JEL0837]